VHVQRSVGLGILQPGLTVGIARLDARPRTNRAHVMMPDATCEEHFVSASLISAAQTRLGRWLARLRSTTLPSRSGLESRLPLECRTSLVAARARPW